MGIHWASLLAVFVVSLGSTVGVVVVVTVTLLRLSARTTRGGSAPQAGRPHTPPAATFR
jgi:hypothetical protein